METLKDIIDFLCIKENDEQEDLNMKEIKIELDISINSYVCIL